MSPRRVAFLAQARSDYDIFLFLKGQSRASCHWLHYLQMATEKLAKAYFWGTTAPPYDLRHDYFYEFVRLLVSKTRVRDALGFGSLSELRASLSPFRAIARKIEALSPSVAGERENVEYPFPRSNPTIAPVNHPQFAVEPMLTGPDGVRFLNFLDRLFAEFDSWF